MKKPFLRIMMMTLTVIMMSFTTAWGETTYTASPSGWTSVPTSNVTITSENVTAHGNLLIARAVISGSTVTFQVKKNDGSTFQNATKLNLYENSVNGTRKKYKTFTAGQSILNIDYDLDFTSGSKKYCLSLMSRGSNGDIWYYTNPITITANSTTTTPAKPDYTTFTGTNITANSFEASWSHVTGATKYEINVATDKSYNPIVFNSTTANNYITVTGLQPNTSYYFQVRAYSNGQWSEWSKSISTPVTTKSNAPAKPDYTTFTGTNITANSFEASWSHVTGATKYEINVATDKSYNPIVFNSTTSNNYITVNGLQPNTSYYFQVRAYSNGQWSEWSKSISTPVTTLAGSSTGSSKLVIAGGSYFNNNSTTLQKGQSTKFNIKIKNESNAEWSGSFYLKGNGTNWISWGGKSIAAGGTLEMTDYYTPTATGNYTVTLYYQTDGHGDGVPVAAGYYKNPFAIAVTDGQSTTALDHPDNSSLKATEIGATSFRANWGTVSGATYYNVLMKPASDQSFDNGKKGFGTQEDPSYVFTGLKPGTTYQFQVQSCNAKETSSYTKFYNVTTKDAEGQKANLSIFNTHTLEGSERMIVGDNCTYRVSVMNADTNPWSGKFILRQGTKEICSWIKNNVSGNKSAVSMSCPYTLTEEGMQTLTLYYQTGCVGQEVMVKSGEEPNPLYFQVNNSNATVCKLVTKSNITASAESMDINNLIKFQARVYNEESDEWSGRLYFTVDGELISAVPATIAAGKYFDVSSTYQTDIPGEHIIGLSYRKNNDSGIDPQPVLLNGKPCMLVITLIDPDNLPAPDKANIVLASDGLYPSEVREGAVVNYFFRITDVNRKPLRNVRASFSYDNGSSAGQLESELSEADGIAVLQVQTEGGMAVADKGQIATIKCKGLSFKDDTKIEIANTAEITPIKLKVYKGGLFENVEKVDFTVDVGFSGSADVKVADVKANVGVPLKLSMKVDDAGNISNYTMGIGVKGGFGASVDVGSYSGEIGWESGKEYSLTTSSLKDMLFASIYKLCEAWGSSTSTDCDFAVKVLTKWFNNKNYDIKVKKSNYLSMELSGKKSFKAVPRFTRGSLLTGKTKVVLDPGQFSDFSISGKVKFKYKPSLEETQENFLLSDDNISTESRETSYGEAVNLSYALTAGGSFNSNNILFGSKKAWWRGSNMGKFYESKLLDKLKYDKVGLSASGELEFEEEEVFSDKARTKLKELSHEMGFKAGVNLSLTNLVNPWGKDDDVLSFDVSSSTKMKMTAKDQFAKQLWTWAKDDRKKDFVSNVFPVFTDQTHLIVPLKIFTVWKGDVSSSLNSLMEGVGNPSIYTLENSLTVSQSNSTSVKASLMVPLINWTVIKFNFNAGLTIATNFRPTVSYYSTVDRRFFPVVLQPTNTIEDIINSVWAKLAQGIKGAFSDDEQDEIESLGEEMGNPQTSEVMAGTMVDMNFDGYQRDYVGSNRAMAAHVRRRHPALLDKPQTDICTLGFNINNGEQNFVEGTKLNFTHYYPAGDLLAVTDTRDTLFVVSEVATLSAKQNDNALQKSHQGSFRLDTYVGHDDLAPFGLPDDVSLGIYHSVKGSDMWHYVGPAGIPVLVDSLGEYILATSLHNDRVAPEISMSFNQDTRVLRLTVSDNIGVNTNSLELVINGEVREVEALNETNYMVQLTDDDMQYLLEVYATVYDIAGNQGSAGQMFNLDMPQRPNIIDMPEDMEVTDISAIENVIYIEPTEVRTGSEAELSVKMKNSVEAEGFGFDLYLPDGLTFKTDVDGFPEAYLSTLRTTARKTNTFESVIRPDGALRVMAASTNGSVISGSDGEVATVKIHVDSDVTPGVLPIILRQIAISDSEAHSYDTEEVKSYVTVLDGTLDIQSVYTSRQTRPADNHIYNLQGQRVASPSAPGIYVKNGRKFVVK